jgi:hypothetical protein
MANAKKRPPAATIEEATQESAALWAAYREARQRSAPAAEFDALRAKVTGALSRTRKRSSEPGFSTVAQQLVDLREYIKRFQPREAAAPVSAQDLLREVNEIRRSLDGLGEGAPEDALRTLAARAAKIHERIDEARRQAPDDDVDYDHDSYVDAEEHLWDLGARLGTRRRA